jgi:hypothetical protein
MHVLHILNYTFTTLFLFFPIDLNFQFDRYVIGSTLAWPIRRISEMKIDFIGYTTAFTTSFFQIIVIIVHVTLIMFATKQLNLIMTGMSVSLSNYRINL